MKTFLFIPTVLFFSILCLQVKGQNKFSVEGTVTDTAALPLSAATVVLLQEKDSVLVSFTLTHQDGKFVLKKVAAGSFILQITYLGFQNFSKKISLPFEGGNYDFGAIKLLPVSANLDEVVVKAEHIPIVFKKDTIEYNAAAFKTQPNAVVEDLLKKLPGVEVDREGNIKAQGKTVERVLVDGKEFFGNDPKIATKNLPADAVGKVQVFDKKSEMAEFTGIEDGKKEKTINLALKEGKKKGYFGNVSGGYGSDSRYEGKANINHFGKKIQLSGIGMLNNINEQGFSINDYLNFMGGLQNMMSGGGGGGLKLSLGGEGGVPLNLGKTDGILTTFAGGLNFNYDFNKKTKLRSSYFYNRIKTDIERTATRQNLLDDRSFNSEEKDGRFSQNTNHRLNFTLRHEIDSFQNIILRSTIGFNEALLRSLNETKTFNAENALENTGLRNNHSAGDNFNLTSNLIYRRRFHKKGRAFVADLSFGSINADRKAALGSINNFLLQDDNEREFSDTLQQRQTLANDETDFGVNLSYTEPIGKRKYLEINYARQNFSNESVKDFFDVFPNAEPRELFNAALSNHYQRDYTYNRAGLNFKLNGKKSNLTTGLSLQDSKLEGEILSQEVSLRKDFFNVLPSLRWNYDIAASRNLSFDYETTVREPSLEQLQPVVDNSDPLNTFTGNPELRPEYRHNFKLNFMSFDQFSFTNIFVSLDAIYTNNKITNSRNLDSLFRQNIQPVNVDGDFILNGYLSFGTPLKLIKSRININTNLSYNHGILLVNNVENKTDRVITSVDVSIENRKKEVVDIAVGAKLSHNTTKYSVSKNLNQTFLNQTYYADFALQFGKTWSLGSSMDYALYSGESFGSSREIPIWKASLSKFILKNKRGQFKFSVFDLLDKNVGINRNSELNYIEEERIRSLGRYFMFGFSYSLSGFGGNNSPGIDIQVRQR